MAERHLSPLQALLFHSNGPGFVSRAVPFSTRACADADTRLPKKEAVGYRRGAWASDVLEVLVGGLWPTHSELVRVGQMLGKLARCGKVKKVSGPGESHRYEPLEADLLAGSG